MAITITEDCICCGACEAECPNDAISEADGIYVIAADLCTECVGFNPDLACQSVCPVECCVPDPELEETEDDLIQRALELHPDDEQLRQQFDSGQFSSRFRAR
jgi:ferredoxin